MPFRASYRYAPISAQKVRLVADMVRGKNANEALNILRYQPQRGARMLEKTIHSAIGNAQDPEQSSGTSVNPADLIVALVTVDGGPMMKRIRPRARGMAFPIKKRSSHINVTLSEVGEEI